MSPPWDGLLPDPRPVKPGPFARLILGTLRAYKLLASPLFAGSCRFHPSCSTYMAEAISVHGVVRGVGLGIIRLSRCHPLGSSGFDPVPPRRS
jgi:putative membrane protein insertion efficiency factor